MKYYVLFPETQNVHLIKDVGMLAYKLSQLFSVDAYIACYNNDEYQYINRPLKGLKIKFIKKRTSNSILDGIFFLREESKEIDVLQIFHVTIRSVLYAAAYKLYNKRGKIFLKLDCTEELLLKIKRLKSLQRKLFNWFFKMVDVIGVEKESLYKNIRELLPQFASRFLYLPNGIDYRNLDIGDISFKDKENYILQVGRLGAVEKNTEMLLKAFGSACGEGHSKWKLLLVGEKTSEFESFAESYLKQNSHLSESVEFIGRIDNRDELMDVYRKSKIFCLTSQYESFGIVLIEAASCGNVIVSTDVGIAKELTVNGGAIVKPTDKEALVNALKNYMDSEELERICYENIKLVKDKYNWDNIAAALYEKIASGGK